MKFLQKLGKSMMLPIAVLPICGILMGIGYLMCPVSMQGGEIEGVVQGIGYVLVTAGGAIINNMSILFVIGVALGMSEDNSGIACLAGIASWLTITVMLSNKELIPLDEIAKMALGKIQNPFIGILCGLVGAICYNKFKNIKLPDVFAFFSGKRFVAIATVLISVVMACILYFVWPLVFSGLYWLGNVLKDAGGIGAGVYAFLNRLLIPTGLHHALNNVFWFDTIGIGDLTNFWAGKTSADVGYSLGCYMSGFFPCMMFGIPAAALAFYQKAKNKKAAASILISCSICAFVCGLTEPFEFSFMLMAFPLYVIYSFLYGVFTVITYYTGFRAGFSFSAGAIDLGFSASLPAANKTWMILILGAAAFVVFYFVFRLYLSRSKVQFFADVDQPVFSKISIPGSISNKANRFTAVATQMIAAVGGAANVVSCDCCATRLRLELKDGSLVKKDAAKKGGALGLFAKGTSCQIVIGTTVQQVCDEFNRLLKQPANHKKITHGQIISLGNKARTDVADNDFSLGKFTYTVKDPAGLHARPAGKIVKLVKEKGATATISLGEKEATATSLTQLMGLGIKQGDTITISSDDEKALKDLKALIEEIL